MAKIIVEKKTKLGLGFPLGNREMVETSCSSKPIHPRFLFTKKENEESLLKKDQRLENKK
jgi:hypothetical protein